MHSHLLAVLGGKEGVGGSTNPCELKILTLLLQYREEYFSGLATLIIWSAESLGLTRANISRLTGTLRASLHHHTSKADAFSG